MDSGQWTPCELITVNSQTLSTTNMLRRGFHRSGSAAATAAATTVVSTSHRSVSVSINLSHGTSLSTECKTTPSDDDNDSVQSLVRHPALLSLSQSSMHHQLKKSCRKTRSKSMVLLTPSPQEKPGVLLLEGDPYILSSDGVARSLYRIQTSPKSVVDRNKSRNGHINMCNIDIEEIYDIEKNQKLFVIHKNDSLTQPMLETKLSIQELNNDVCAPSTEINHRQGRRCCGTGSRTWDSSIAMALYLASCRPDILNGKDVIELGSGVGLGGILTSYLHSNSFRSFTLTDYNPRVLKQCEANVRRVQKDSFLSSITATPNLLHVSQLDWNDFVSMTATAPQFAGRYDIVLACDCAYRYEDLDPLVRTMLNLLRGNSKRTAEDVQRHSRAPSIHIFGPANRGGLVKLIEKFREMDTIQVQVESIEMTKCRLDPEELVVKMSASLSANTYPFLHVECKLRHNDGRGVSNDLTDNELTCAIMEEID